MDENCTNVNRIFHGSNTIINETHPLFGTAIALDKYFKIVETCIKERDKANFSANMVEMSKKTGINLLNGRFHVRKVTLADEQVKRLREKQEITYNMQIFPHYHFCVKGNVCKEVFANDNVYENADSLYYYIIINR